MQLILPVPALSADLDALLRRRPFLLLPVLGKPLVEYHLELASSLGAERVVLLSDDRPERVRDAVRSGQRWGLAVEVVAVPRGLELAAQLSRLPAATEERWLLAADALVPPVAGERGARRAPVAQWEDEHGWVLRGVEGSALPTVRVADRRLHDARRFLEVQLDLLEQPAGFVLPGFEVAPGIFASRGGRFSLAAVEHPPVLVGAHARVSDRARLGPSVAVGPRALVDEEATLARSVVMPQTYVGRLLAGEELILDGRLVLDTRSGAVAAIDDDLLLADLSSTVLGGRVQRFRDRAVACLLCVLLSPVLVAAWVLAEQPRRARREVFGERERLTVGGRPERLPSAVSEFRTARVLLRRAGWLLDAAAGRIRLVGVPPLDRERAVRLDPAMRERWLEGAPGVYGLAQNEGFRRGAGETASSADAEDAETAAALLQAGGRGGGWWQSVLGGLACYLRPSAWRVRGRV